MSKYLVFLLISFILSNGARAATLEFEGEQGRQSLFASQPAESSVISLNFRDQDINEEFAQHLQGFLRGQRNSLVSLVFNGCRLHPLDGTSICSFSYLSCLGVLKHFAMTNCGLTDAAAGGVLRSLNGCTVETIDLSGNDLDESSDSLRRYANKFALSSPIKY